ncbi:hypothetical protein C0995_011781 [Termitomyces sp. Mi166|nr:hypothetical protein C0995_011781 [Termitomyces sp. Mi166\
MAMSMSSNPPFDPDNVVTTDRLDAYIDDARRPMLNNYTRHAKIGDGHHGEVYLCYQLNTKLPLGHSDRRIPVAMKSVKRDNPRAKQFRKLRQQRLPTSAHTPLVDRLGTTEAKIRKEIAIMKKCRHPHVVRLYEVIDDRSKEKIYMVMEYLAGGEVKWTNEHSQPILSYDQTRRIIRDAVLGLEYLHHQGIIHRDIKPANLLYTQDRCQVKIADFGVSHFSYAQRLAAAGAGALEDTEDILLNDSDLTKRAGTPSFLAPEIVYEHTHDPSSGSSSSSADVPSAGLGLAHVRSSQSISAIVNANDASGNYNAQRRPPITKSIDVWALGVTLYCLLFGKTPFTADPAASGTEWSLYNSICNLDWTAEETMCVDRVATGGRRPKNKSTSDGNEDESEHAKGPMVMRLLDRLLRKDPKDRITLDEVKHHPWLLQDIPERTQWLKYTMPKGKIDVSADETSDAMSTIRFQWNWNWNSVAKRVSSLFRRERKERERERERDKGEHVKSDPHATINAGVGAVGLRRHQSARLPDDSMYYPHAHTHTHAHAHGKKDKGKGKGKHRELLRPSTGEAMRPKSTEPWPIAGRGRGGARVSTGANASRSTSAIPFRRRGSGNGSVGSASTATERTTNTRHKGSVSSSVATSVSTSPTATPTTDKPRARFSNFFSIGHWRPNKFSSAFPPASTSTFTPTSASTTTEATAASSVSASIFTRTNTDGTITVTRRSEEVLRHYPNPHHPNRPHDADMDEGRGMTADRRASSWGQQVGGLSAQSSWDFLRPGAGGGGGGGREGGGGVYYEHRFAPRTPSRLSMSLGTDEGAGAGETSPTSLSTGFTSTPSDEVGAGMQRRESDNDRFGPAYYDEDSSTIASAGEASGSGKGSGSEEDEPGEERRRRRYEDEDEDEDEDDSDEEHGVVFSPRKRASGG